MLRRTKFYDLHVSLGAKMVGFGGFDMPVQYSGIVEEHLAVRRSLGVFDISHMGNIIVRGKDALGFLQKVTINDAAKLTPGKMQYSAMCYKDGGIVDDLLVYRMDDHYRLVVNASNRSKDLEWMKSNKSGNVEIEDISDNIASLAIQGPNSLATLQKLTDEKLSEIKYYYFINGKLAGLPMVISRSGYTGELGFEIFFNANDETAKKVWNAIFDAGREFGIIPSGLGSRDTLRLEMGYCLYGNDIDKTTNPLEAGLGWITKLDKSDFNGRDVIIDAKKKGLKRKLVGFTSMERLLPRHGYEIFYNDNVVGKVTSGTYSPSLQKGIGMGYVPVEIAVPGTVVSMLIREKKIPATIEKVPFVQVIKQGTR